MLALATLDHTIQYQHPALSKKYSIIGRRASEWPVAKRFVLSAPYSGTAIAARTSVRAKSSPTNSKGASRVRAKA